MPGPNGSVRICLELTDPRFEDVFAVLADDVAAAVSCAKSEPAGIVALIGRLNTWQRFLKRHGGGVLAERERIGLFAELTVLRDLLADGLSAGDAVDAWRGPWGGAQDFRLATCSVEVKATASASSASFEVSNLDQLDERLLPCLIVRHIVLSRPNGRGETLPELVDAVAVAITATDPAASLRFSDSLLEVGYLDAHRAEYEEERLAVFSDRLFQVQDGFPRILADDVRPGVSACSYTVQLSACLPFLVDGNSARRIIHGEHDE